MKKILIDIDDTILIDCYLDIVNKFLNTNYTYNDISGYWVDTIVPKELEKEYLDYIYNKINIYDYGKVSDNAISVIKDLCKYYEVFICSAYIDERAIKDCANFLVDKHNWLVDNLPFINPENFIFTNRKDVIEVDIIIDDKIENLNNASVKLLMSAYHNKNISDYELNNKNIIRVNSWNDVKEILLNH